MNLITAVIMFVLLSQDPTVGAGVAEKAQQNPRQDSDNSLHVARIVKDEGWMAITPANGLPGILRRVSPEGTVRDYILAVFPSSVSPTPRWRINGDYFYAVAQLPGNNGLGHILVRMPLKELKNYPSAEERSKGVISLPPIDYLSLAPLDPYVIVPDQPEESPKMMMKRADVIRHDFFINENEKISLAIIAEGKLELWEIESRNRWTSFASDESTDASTEWKRVAVIPIALSDRFILKANEGRLSLVTETGEVWQSDDRATFRKLNEAVTTDADGHSLLIEDTDKRQVWLSRTSEHGAVTGERLHPIIGTDGAPSDRVRTAARKLAERNR